SYKLNFSNYLRKINYKHSLLPMVTNPYLCIFKHPISNRHHLTQSLLMTLLMKLFQLAILFYLFINFISLYSEYITDNTVIIIIIKDIGLVKKVRRLEFNSNDRNKLCSKFCPKITPNTSGLIGTSALTNKYPIIPNTNNDH